MPPRSKRRRTVVSYKEPSDAVVADEDAKEMTAEEDEAQGGAGLTVKAYRTRLVSNGKELYKDPPCLPPAGVSVKPGKAALPKRDAKTRRFKFDDHPEFKPNLSPEEVLRRGSFGGTYFRAIESAVTGTRILASEALASTVPKEWIDGVDKTLLTSSTYDARRNRYGVKCGGSLGMWESSGWISELDPYGAFQWYCRFFQGRRTTDDSRQISRFLGVMGDKGRFRTQLMNKCLNGGAAHDDVKISPVIRQSLQHWGYELTAPDLEAHRKKKARSGK